MELFKPSQPIKHDQPLENAKPLLGDPGSGSLDPKMAERWKILGALDLEASELFTPEATRFLISLEDQFSERRAFLLERRKEIQSQLDSGWRPDFLPETLSLRSESWQVAEIPVDLIDRRVEITAPVDAKMIINAMNSGAQVFMADFEDAHSPVWEKTLKGQLNLKRAIQKTLIFRESEEKTYQIQDPGAVLFVRPRGWHLTENKIQLDGREISASLFDFGLYFFHNVHELMKQGKRPYFYLPKLENHLEARLWNEVFEFAQNALGVPRGSIRATVLIENILAAFEMDEILYELRDHSAGLNCGRWDYIFSFMKKLRNDPQCVLPDRSQLSMNVHFLKSYAQLLIQTCHRREIHAMGGMAADIPVRGDPEQNALALKRVAQDKVREVRLGHDGTWVAHPALVAVARQVFSEGMKDPHQIHEKRSQWKIQAADLLRVPPGSITEQGLRTNLRVCLWYLESWLRGVGCVPIDHFMEDAATAEISRVQVWQWIHYRRWTEKEFLRILNEERNQIKTQLGDDAYRERRFELSSELLVQMITGETWVEFFTIHASQFL
ncbi:MAG: malate synthase A [Bdellovibrionia bacterium]